MGGNSITTAHPHVRPMGLTCRWAGKIKKNPHPKILTALFCEQGTMQQSFENNMFRAPIYKHALSETDFLIIRRSETRGVKTVKKFYIRRVPAAYTVGQLCPKIDVPAPKVREPLRAPLRALLRATHTHTTTTHHRHHHSST